MVVNLICADFSVPQGVDESTVKFKQKQTLVKDGDDNLIIYGFKESAIKTWMTFLLSLISLGTLRLIFHWYPVWKLYSTHSKCHLGIAEKVLIVDKYQGYKSYFVEDVRELSADPNRRKNNGNNLDSNIPLQKLSVYLGDGYLKGFISLRAVWCKRLCYVWDDERREFVKLVGLDKGRSCAEFHSFGGHSKEEQKSRSIIYGKNEINIPMHTIFKLLLLEALTPFYIFQVFSLIVWFAESYYYYTIAIVIMSVFGIASSIIQTRKNQKSLQETVHSAANVVVYHNNGTREEILSNNLVPGDLIEIPKTGCIMQCDAVLLNGNCVVNESMLTGESVPITKTRLPKTNAIYDVKEDSFHTLFCGTTVIQTRKQGSDKIFAVVIRTGFLTSKGELVRSILYPPPSDFKFDQDSYKFIGILTIISLLGCVYTIVSKIERGITVGDIIIKALDLITIVVPPALPAAMTVGKLYALNRLKNYKIYCMNSRVINVSGSIDCVCFDKTGTLTEDGLDMWGVALSLNNILQQPTKDVSLLNKNSPLLIGMATCHSLTMIDDALCGDPLDIKVFQSTGWVLEEALKYDASSSTESLAFVAKPPQVPQRKVSSISRSTNNINQKINEIEIEIVQQYQFSSNLQRMSVVTKFNGSERLQVYCKGSPEMIVSLSTPESVPVDISNRLKEFTVKGYRVIALGTKTLTDEMEKLERSAVESNLTFAGLIILENRIKAETSPVIKLLKQARVKTVMITGDNIQTAVSVAKECGIVENNQIITEVTVKLLDAGQPRISFSVTNFIQSQFDDLKCKNGISLVENGNFGYQYVYAITGSTWTVLKEHFSEEISEIVDKGVVFARMSGKQKQQLVEELKSLGYYVAMCGDGANDCGALKAAHVGISLSEEDSSVASPFTSKTPNISCVPTIIKEGRAALTTSIGVFKFMVCYSLTQFATVIILYGIDCNLNSLQFLFIDICLALNFMSFFGKTEAYDGPLDKKRPPTSLLSFLSLTSITSQLLMVVVFQVGAYKLVQTYDWFVPYKYNEDNPTNFISYENHAVYCFSMFQYVIMAITFSKGKPYRKAIYTNFILSTIILLMTSICIYINLKPAEWVTSTLELVVFPNLDFSYVILLLAFSNFLCSLLFEDVIVGYVLDKRFIPKIKQFVNSKGTNGNTETLHLRKISNEYERNEIVICVDEKKINGKVPLFANDPTSNTTKL